MLGKVQLAVEVQAAVDEMERDKHSAIPLACRSVHLRWKQAVDCDVHYRELQHSTSWLTF